jgi:antitoxin component YwqK of YwqJK toxin-antitoxin module
MIRVHLEELDYPGDRLYYLNGQPFTGVVVYLSEEGWTQAEEEYREGLLSGWKREWHRPGVLEREAQCAWGARHGLCREWDEDGLLVAENSYEYGVRVSGRRWDSKGSVTEDFQLQESDPAFQIIQACRAPHQRDQGTN